MNNKKHKKVIFINCWKCGKRFDIVSAKRCYDHLNQGSRTEMYEFTRVLEWTTKCSHCDACICHKINKMKKIKCNVLNKVGIMRVMPSVKRKLIKNE